LLPGRRPGSGPGTQTRVRAKGCHGRDALARFAMLRQYDEAAGGGGSLVWNLRTERPRPAGRRRQPIREGKKNLCPAELKSVRSVSTCLMKRSTACGGASPRHAGPAGNSSRTGRRACSWRRPPSSPATGRPITTGAGFEARLNALPQFKPEIDGVDAPAQGTPNHTSSLSPGPISRDGSSGDPGR